MQWPSDKAGRAPQVPFFHKRDQFDLDFLFGRRRQPRYQPSALPANSEVVLLSEVEADQIRQLAKTVPSATWLDPAQTPVRVELASDVETEYRVELYHWEGIPERDSEGCRTGYMVEQEVSVQVLVVRQIKNGRVIRETEIDWETVPLWHFIDKGALGESFWRSDFAEYIV